MPQTNASIIGTKAIFLKHNLVAICLQSRCDVRRFCQDQSGCLWITLDYMIRLQYGSNVGLGSLLLIQNRRRKMICPKFLSPPPNSLDGPEKIVSKKQRRNCSLLIKITFSTGWRNDIEPKSLHVFSCFPIRVLLSRVRAIQFGIVMQSSSVKARLTNPALIVLAPLSITSVFASRGAIYFW